MKFSKEKRVGYTREQVYQVILDIDSYQDYLPFCVESRIVRKEEKDDALHMLTEVQMGFRAIQARALSRMKAENSFRFEATNANDDVFNYFYSTCVLHAAPFDTCVVEISIRFEFANHAHSLVASVFMRHVAKKVVKAFEARCYEKFGAPKELEIALN